MEEYKQALIARIEELKTSNSPFARANIKILLRLLGELENQK